MYLEHRTTASSRDVVISDYTLLKPGSTEKLLDATTLKLVAGRRYGLCGRNGVGKSTLLREIAAYRIAGFPQNLKVQNSHPPNSIRLM
jgi:ATPase subunit of ABC transporter with duplicated ATPase domains